MYDAWKRIANLNPQSPILQSFTWDPDQSGSKQGAGGVGGLLMSPDTAEPTTNYVAFEGKGNLAALVNAANGAVSANYEYGR